MAASRNSAGGKKGEQKEDKTPHGTWIGGARTGSLWLCYERPLTSRQESGISGSRQKPKPTLWERNS